MDPFAPEPIDPQDPPTQQPAPAPSSELMDPWKRHLEEQVKGERQFLSDAAARAAKATPEATRRAQRLADAHGVTPEAITSDPKLAEELLRHEAYVKAVQDRRYPMVAAQLATTDMYESVTREELEQFQKTEGVFSWIGANVKNGFNTVLRGVSGTVWAGDTSLSREEVLERAKDYAIRPVDNSGWIGWTGEALEVAGQWAANLVTSELVSLPFNLVPGVGKGLAKGAKQATSVGLTMSSEGGNAYLDYLEAGYDPDAARAAAALVGITNGALEYGGMRLGSAALRKAGAKLIRKGVSEALIKPTMGRAWTTFALDYVKSMGSEVGTEIMQEIVQMAGEDIARAATNPNLAGVWETSRGEEEAFARVLGVAEKTFKAMILLGLPGPVANVWIDTHRAKTSEAHSKALTDIVSGAANLDDLRKNSPGVFRAMIDQLADQNNVDTLWVDKVAMRQLLDKDAATSAKAGVTSAEEVLNETVPGFKEAMASKDQADVTIPTGLFLEKLAGRDLGNALTPHLRTDQGNLSADEMTRLAPYLDKMADEATDMVSFSAEEQKLRREQLAEIQETIRKEITAAGRPAMEARLQARLLGAFIDIQSQQIEVEEQSMRDGESVTTTRVLTPKEFHERFNIRTVKDGSTSMSQLRVQARRTKSTPSYGKPVKGASSFTGVHFSQAPRTSLDSSRYGTGRMGAERARVAGDKQLSKRVYFYYDTTGKGIDPEYGVGGVAHTVQLENIYDTYEDPLGIVEKWSSKPGRDPNALEKAILKAGFDGYAVPGAFVDQGMIVVIGDKHRNIPVNQPKVKLKQTKDELPKGKPIDPKVREAASLPTARKLKAEIEKAQNGKRAKNRQLKEAIQAHVLAAHEATGGTEESLTTPSEEQVRHLVDTMTADAELLLSEEGGKQAIGWYDLKVSQALALLSEVHPELRTSKTNKFAFLAVLAVTSNGMKVDKNFDLAEQAYAIWKAEGKFPEDGRAVSGKRVNEMRETFAWLNQAVAEHGAEKLYDLFLTRDTVGNFKKLFGISVGKELIDTEVFGAAVLGPKIGNGFFMNLNGEYGQLTADVWFTRTWRRMFAGLLEIDPERVAEYQGIVRAAADATDRTVKVPVTKPVTSAQAKKGKTPVTVDMTVEELVGMPLNSDPMELAKAIAKKAQLRYWREAMALVPGGDTLRKAANGLVKNSLGDVDAPKNGSELILIRRVVGETLANLRKNPAYEKLTVADLQAVLWYGEKLLYEEKSADPNAPQKDAQYDESEAPDYANAAAALVRRSGVTDERVTEILERVASERAGGGGVGGRAAQPAADTRSAELQQAEDAQGRRSKKSVKLKQTRDSLPAGTPLDGLPTLVEVDGKDVTFGPHETAREAAREYARRTGLAYYPPTVFVPVDADRAVAIAEAYDDMLHDPNNPEVKAAYEALVKETLAQWQVIKETGLKVEFIEGEDPYGNPRNAILDIVENNHMWVFPTDAGYGEQAGGITNTMVAENPMLALVPGETWNGKPVRVNDIFRVVHDYFGHVKEGVGFRARGEENAWQQHMAMYSPLARKALTVETRGQNSWVNFGPQARFNRTASGADTKYAEQKVGLLPDWAVNDGYAGGHSASLRLQQTIALNEGFYSRLEQEVSNAPFGGGKAAQWTQFITGLVNKGKVKKEEVDYTGIFDWFDTWSDDTKFTKEDVLNFLTVRGIRVTADSPSGAQYEFVTQIENISRQATEGTVETRDRLLPVLEQFEYAEMLLDLQPRPGMDIMFGPGGTTLAGIARTTGHKPGEDFRAFGVAVPTLGGHIIIESGLTLREARDYEGSPEMIKDAVSVVSEWLKAEGHPDTYIKKTKARIRATFGNSPEVRVIATNPRAVWEVHNATGEQANFKWDEPGDSLFLRRQEPGEFSVGDVLHVSSIRDLGEEAMGTWSTGFALGNQDMLDSPSVFRRMAGRPAGYPSPHWGSRYDNLIHVRGYQGPDVVLLEELQSDWANSLRGAEAPAPNTVFVNNKGWVDLGLKRAVQWAARSGATYLALPDGYAAAKMEGHELTNPVGNNFDATFGGSILRTTAYERAVVNGQIRVIPFATDPFRGIIPRGFLRDLNFGQSSYPSELPGHPLPPVPTMNITMDADHGAHEIEILGQLRITTERRLRPVPINVPQDGAYYLIQKWELLPQADEELRVYAEENGFVKDDGSSLGVLGVEFSYYPPVDPAGADQRADAEVAGILSKLYEDVPSLRHGTYFDKANFEIAVGPAAPHLTPSGEGLKTYYDDILTKAADKLLPKLGLVKETEVPDSIAALGWKSSQVWRLTPQAKDQVSAGISLLQTLDSKAADAGAPAVVNIGLNIGDSLGLTAEQVVQALEAKGIKVVRWTQKTSDTEVTLVAALDRPLTPEEGNALSAELQQEAIALRHSDGTGVLYGPKAKEWGPYNSAYFLMLTGQRASDFDAETAAAAQAATEAEREALPGAPPLPQPMSSKASDNTERGGIVIGGPEDLQISLTTDSDASTWLHELGHYFLEVYSRMSEMAGVSPEHRANWLNLLKWLGVTEEQWRAMTPQERVNLHEKFAYTFELYLFRGVAPDLRMKPMFERFRAWLVEVYKDKARDPRRAYARATGEQLDDVSPEVAEVIDRMLVSDATMKAARAAYGAAPLFFTKAEFEALGLSPDDWDRLKEAQDLADAEAIGEFTRKSMRDMKWLRGARSKVLREMQKEAKALRDDARAGVEAEIAEQPVYRLARWLAGRRPVGEQEDVTGGRQFLNRDQVEAEFPFDDRRAKYEAAWGKHLSGNGSSPAAIAQVHGFADAAEMIDALASAKPFEEAVEERLDEVMLERHGELSDPAKIEAAVDEALHNEARVRFVATELSLLSKATMPERVMVAAAKLAAAAALQRVPVRSISQYEARSSAQREGRRARVAMSEGKIEDAMIAKRRQLYYEQLALESVAAREEVGNVLRSFKKYFAKDENIAKKRDLPIVYAIRAILAAHDIGGNKKQKAKILENSQEFLRQLKEYDPVMFTEVSQIIEDATAAKASYKDMAYGDFLRLRDVVEALWHNAEARRSITVNGQKKAIEDARNEMADQAVKWASGPGKKLPAAAGQTQAPGVAATVLRKFKGLRALGRRAEFLFDEVDGYSKERPWTRYLFEPVQQGVDQYRIERTRLVKKYLELLRAIEPQIKEQMIKAPKLGYTFGAGSNGLGLVELIGALLHAGNKSNLSKLLIGRKWIRKETAFDDNGELNDQPFWDTVRDLEDAGVITKEVWDFVHSVWRLMDEMKKPAQEAHRALYGTYFKEVKAWKVKTKWGEIEGGYVPAKVDPELDSQARIFATMEELEADQRNSMPTTGRGFTMKRVEDYARPLSLDIRRIVSHIDQVTRFSYVQPRVREAVRLIKDQDLMDTLALRDPGLLDGTIMPWLVRSASQRTSTAGLNKDVDKFYTGLRTRTGMATMFGNISNTLQQVTGWFPALLKVKPSYLWAALGKFLRDRKGLAAEVAGLSKYMDNRLRNQVIDAQAEIDDIVTNPSRYQKAKAWSKKNAYVLQSGFQNIVDIVTWSGAYEQAVAAKDPNPAAAADAAVRQTQGSTNPEALASYEAGTPFTKMWTQFQGYFNMLANLNYTEAQKAATELGWKGARGRLFSVYFLGFAAPMLVADAIARTFKGEWDDEDDDGYGDEIVDWFVMGQFRGALALIPHGGQLAVVAANSWNDKPYDDRMMTSPSISALEAATVGVTRAAVNAFDPDKDFTGKNLRDVLTLITLFTGIPVALAGRPLGYGLEVAGDRVTPYNPADFGRGLITGATAEGTRKP